MAMKITVYCMLINLGNTLNTFKLATASMIGIVTFHSLRRDTDVI